MKWLSLFLLLLLFSCSENEFEVEDQMYNCLLSHAKKEKIDLTKELTKLEKKYVKCGLLSNTSGKAKIAFYENILKTGDFPKLPRGCTYDSSLFKALKWFNDPVCIDKVEELDAPKSKYFQLREKMESLMSTGDATAVQGVKVMLEVLDA